MSRAKLIVGWLIFGLASAGASLSAEVYFRIKKFDSLMEHFKSVRKVPNEMENDIYFLRSHIGYLEGHISGMELYPHLLDKVQGAVLVLTVLFLLAFVCSGLLFWLSRTKKIKMVDSGSAT